jgi:hypothetical protein
LGFGKCREFFDELALEERLSAMGLVGYLVCIILTINNS